MFCWLACLTHLSLPQRMRLLLLLALTLALVASQAPAPVNEAALPPAQAEVHRVAGPPPAHCHRHCRTRAFRECGVGMNVEKKRCRRRYFVGCLREHGCDETQTVPTPTVPPEPTCDVVCRTQAYRKCGMLDRDVLCRTRYAADCIRLNCGTAPCELDCRMSSFSACGTELREAECRREYVKTCVPARCCKNNCAKSALLVCGHASCRRRYIRQCAQKKMCKRFRDRAPPTTAAPTKNPCIKERWTKRCSRACRSHPVKACTRSCTNLGEGRKVCRDKCRHSTRQRCKRTCIKAREAFDACSLKAVNITDAPDPCKKRKLVKACNTECKTHPGGVCMHSCMKVKHDKTSCTTVCKKVTSVSHRKQDTISPTRLGHAQDVSSSVLACLGHFLRLHRHGCSCQWNCIQWNEHEWIEQQRVEQRFQ